VLEGEFPAPIDRVWDAFTDPRKLERFWGPPGYTATFGEVELRPGGTAPYYMTSPEGERMHAAWRITAVDQPNSITFEDVFTDEDGALAEGMPVLTTTVSLAPGGAGTLLTIRSTAPSVEALEQMQEMG